MTAPPPNRPNWTTAAAVSLFSGLLLGVVAVSAGGDGSGSQPSGVESADDASDTGAADGRSPAPSSALRLDEPTRLFAGLGFAWARSDGDPAPGGTAAPSAVGARAIDRATTGPASTTRRPGRSATTASTDTPAPATAPDGAPPIARPLTVAVPTSPEPGRTASPATTGATPPARDTSATTAPAATTPPRTSPPRTAPATTAPATTAPATTSPPTTEAAPAPSTTAPTVPPSTSPPDDDDERGNKGGRSQEAHDDRDERRRSERDGGDDD